jgi:hypothetical protein
MRRLAVLVFLIIAAAAAPAAAAPVTSVTQAPYTVLVVASNGGCTGTLIDPAHVLTSADCALDADRKPLPASAMAILAGTIAQGPLGPDAQHSMVGDVRIHPAYLSTGAADLAMLKLATPLTTTAAVAPVPVVAGGTRLQAASATAYGWSRTGGEDPNARSERTWEIAIAPYVCVWGVAGYDCGTSPAEPRCGVDAGGPVVAPNDPAVLVGVVVGHGPRDCGDRRDVTQFVDLATPGIAQWILGDDTPDPMPSTDDPAVLEAPPRRGGAIGCTAPAWSGASEVKVDFFRYDGAIVQSGRRPTYVPQPSDVGHRLACRSVARSAGGVAVAPALTTVSVVKRRGERYRICVKPAKGARSCRWWRPR